MRTERPDIVVIRHARERVSKYSLRHLHDRPGITFHKAIKHFSFDATGYTELAVDAEPLSPADAGRPLLLLDSTWNLLPELRACVHGETVRRSIPGGVKTAYPRTSRYFVDPTGGLASVEALYVALAVLGYPDESARAQNGRRLYCAETENVPPSEWSRVVFVRRRTPPGRSHTNRS